MKREPIMDAGLLSASCRQASFADSGAPSGIAGVILAGGASRRMGGRPKALLPVGGRPLLLRQLEEMSKLCGSVLIVTNTPDVLRPALAEAGALPAAIRVIPDVYAACGPLGGIHAAGEAAAEELLWVVGCDMPFISAAAAAAMARIRDGEEAVVPWIGGRVQPLHGVYARQAAAAAAERLLRQDERRLLGLLEQIRWRRADEALFRERGLPLTFCANMNTPEEWQRLQQQLYGNEQ